MKNYIQPGRTLTLPAPYDVAAGDGFLVGSIFAVAAGSALSGADVEGVTDGVFDLKKASAQAWTVGAKIYWDNTAKNVTTTSTDNVLIGVAVAVAANPTATGKVRLNGTF